MKTTSCFRILPVLIRSVLCLVLALSLISLTGLSAQQPAAASNDLSTPETTHTVFFNPSGISPADRASNAAGTNPGLPSLYPSPLVVSGLTGTITKVTVAFQASSTFPDDFDILLVGPTGAKTLIISDAGGPGNIVGVGFIFDQSAPTDFPDNSTEGSPVPGGIYRPANYAGFSTPEPGGQDNFPSAGGLQSFPAPNLNVFNGTNPNGTWNLYVVDDQNVDSVSLTSGWSLDITVAPGGCTGAKRPVDLNGDNKTDFSVARDTGGQKTWYTLYNGVGSQSDQWGAPGDLVVPSDYDGDGKTDVAVWRSGVQAFFYILQSQTSTLRIVAFGIPGDDPTVIGDYDGDGKVDPAVYRAGAGATPSAWYYLSSVNGLLQSSIWGQQGDFPIPGDWDGDGKYDNAIQRNIGGGQGGFYRKLSAGGSDAFAFGLSSDVVVPGYYDSDCKQDIAVIRGSGGVLNWYILNSADQSFAAIGFGNSGTDTAVQGDYDGDGRTDVAVFRPVPAPAAFYYLRSTNGSLGVVVWGLNGDDPVASFNSH